MKHILINESESRWTEGTMQRSLEASEMFLEEYDAENEEDKQWITN